MRSTETTRSVPARSRSLLGLLTLGLLAGAPAALAQTTLPGTTPTDTAPVTVPATEPTQPAPVPNLGLPATGAEQVTPPLPTDAAPTQATPADAPDAAPTDAAANDAVPVETAPDDLTPTASSLPAPGSVKVPVLEGEEVLKTVPTVLGEALVYAGDAGNVMARTLVALKADGYTAAGDQADTARVLLSRDGQEFELSGRESFGVTVVALSRVPGTEVTDTAPPETIPTDAAPADTAPIETAPTETTPTESPAEPDTDAPPATTDPATPAPAVPTPAQPPVEPTPVEPAPVTPGQP